MFITIGNFKREMILPAVLAKRRAAGGTLRDGILEIDFLPLGETACGRIRRWKSGLSRPT